MNNIDNSTIRQTIDRFLAGETSCREERELYAFFAGSDVPPDLACYKEMFRWYASLAEDSGRSSAEHPVTLMPAEAPAEATPRRGTGKVRLLSMRAWQWVSAAAVVALLFSIGIIFHSPSTSVPDEYLSYEGSYIIRDGKKITDLSVVVPEIRRTEQMVNERLSALDESIKAADAAFDRSLTSSYHISDPNVREVIEAALTY